jgi:hypothetical protein
MEDRGLILDTDRIFLFSHSSTLALGLVLLLIKGLPVAFSPGVEQSERDADH